MMRGRERMVTADFFNGANSQKKRPARVRAQLGTFFGARRYQSNNDVYLNSPLRLGGPAMHRGR